MSDGSSWSRPSSLHPGQSQLGQSGSQFQQAQPFGAAHTNQFPNPFQQARAQDQSQNWFGQHQPAANGVHNGAPNAAHNGSGAPWTSNPSANQASSIPFSGFPAQNQQFMPSSGSAFANAAAQPFPNNFGAGSVQAPQFPSVGQSRFPNQQQQPKSQQHQFAFTSVASSAVPPSTLNAPVNIQSREQNVRSKQLPQKPKKPTHKDQNDSGHRSQSGSSKKGKQTATQFPSFASAQFPARSYVKSNDSSILKPLPKPLTSINERKDPWDVENQQKLESIEHEYLQGRRSLQDAYDVMNSMREKERREMEKRGLVDSVQVRKSLDDAIVFVGSCTDMCPVYERVRRALENNVLSLEKGHDGKVVASRAVKAFARPAAGNPPALPSDVRPPRVLVDTLRYLVTEIVPKLPDSHAFLWDRTRSIRQDFTFQNFQGPEATWCFEVISRIHIVCLHTMARAAAAGFEWSQQQELEQFNKCLQSLSEFYQQSPTDNEPEMRAYGLLSHLFDEEIVATVDRLPLQVSRHPLVVLALELRTLAVTSVTNFFVRLRQPDVPATFRAILEIHYNKLRIRGVRNLVSSLHRRSSMYPFERFTGLLGFETSDQARQFCSFYDLSVSTSHEAGDEIDIKGWSEENVRDKQSMAQSFDNSLDPLIAQVDVTKPLEIKPGKSHQPSSVSRLLEKQKPKFNVTAPAFEPTQRAQPTMFSSEPQLKSTPNPSTANVFGPSTTTEPPNTTSVGPTFGFTKPSGQASPFQEISTVDRGTVAQPAPKTVSSNLSDVSRPAASPVKPTVVEKPKAQKPTVPDSIIQDLYASSVKAETQKVLQHARLSIQRSRFIDSVAHSIMDSLVTSVATNDSKMTVRAVEYDQLRLKRFIVRNIKQKAARALEHKKERDKQEKELQMFWSRPPSRVVSMPRSQSPPLILPSTTESSEERNGSYQVEEEPEHYDSDEEEFEKFSFLPIVPLLRNVYSNGLTKLAVLINQTSKQGVWLQAVLGSGAIPIEVLPGRVVTLYVVEKGALDYDVGLYGQGAEHPRSVISKDIADVKTLVDLQNAFSDALRDWLIWHENDLLHYRSLNVVNVKRRRISHPSAYTEVVNSPSDSLASVQHSFVAETNERARLRALVAGAKSLMKC